MADDATTRRLSIVIPVYRSARILPTLVEAVEAEMRAAGFGDDFELILVDDASPDDSWPVIQSLAQGHPCLRALCLRRNFGQHNALMAGLSLCRGEHVVLMDDDLQHPPEAIPRMIAALDAGADVCYTRYRNRQHASWKRLGSWFNDRVATFLLNKPRGLYLSSFKALRAEIVREILKYDGPFVYLDGLILDVTRAIASIDIEHRARHEGKGNYTLSRSFALWLRMATNFSLSPLRLATYAGFLLASLSFLTMGFVVVTKLLQPGIQQGWASLIATMLFVGGVQTLCLGMIGEYLGRAYLRINRKPQYVVRYRVG